MNRARRLYRVRRRNLDGHVVTVRIVAQFPAPMRQAQRWSRWASTGSVEVDESTVKVDWQPWRRWDRP